MRTAKPKQPRDYMEGVYRPPPASRGRRALTSFGPADLPFEFMLNALRLNEGFADSRFEARTGLGMEALTVRFCLQRGPEG